MDFLYRGYKNTKGFFDSLEPDEMVSDYLRYRYAFEKNGCEFTIDHYLKLQSTFAEIKIASAVYDLPENFMDDMGRFENHFHSLGNISDALCYNSEFVDISEAIVSLADAIKNKKENNQ